LHLTEPTRTNRKVNNVAERIEIYVDVLYRQLQSEAGHSSLSLGSLPILHRCPVARMLFVRLSRMEPRSPPSRLVGKELAEVVEVRTQKYVGRAREEPYPC